MKILLVNKYHFLKGGAERAYLEMGKILEDAGHEVAYFAMEHPSNISTPWSRFFVSNVEYQTKQSLSEKIRLGFRILWNSEANTKLQMLLDDFQPDIAHCHNIYHQLSPSIFHTLKKNNIPIVLTLHDYKVISPSYTLFARGKIWEHTSGLVALWDRVVDDSFAKSLVCAMEKWLHTLLGSYALVDLFISPSHFLKEKCQTLGFKQEIVVLANPLLPEEGEEIERKAGQLVFVGRLSEEKGVDLILQALALASPEWKLVIVGEGPEKENLQKQTNELGLQSRVVFAGALYGRDLDRKVREAEAILVASLWYENLPYVVSENMAKGLVVIGAKSGGIPEMIQDGENGFLFERGNKESLKKVIESLTEKNLSAVRVQASLIRKTLAPELFVRELEQLYNQLVSKKT